MPEKKRVKRAIWYSALFLIFLTGLSLTPFLTSAAIGGQWVLFSPPSVPDNSVCSPFSTGNYSIFSMSALVSNDGWAVGACHPSLASLKGRAFRWTGASWVNVSLPFNTSALKGVARVSSTDAWAVGNSTGSDAETAKPTMVHWDGTGWTTYLTIDRGNGRFSLNSVSMFSSSSGVAVGENGTIYMFSSPTWTKVSPTPNTVNLTDVAALSNGKAVAVGFTGKTLLFNGATWSLGPSPTAQNLNSVSFINTTMGWAVGDGGTIFVTTNGGTSWTPETSPTLVNLRSVFALDALDVWAVGDLQADNLHPVIVHRDQTGWTLFPTANEAITKGKLWSVSMISGTDVFAAGDFGSLTSFLRFNGPTQITLTSVITSSISTTSSTSTSTSTTTGTFTSTTSTSTVSTTLTSYSTAATSSSTSTYTSTTLTIVPTTTISATSTGTVVSATGTTTTTTTQTLTSLTVTKTATTVTQTTSTTVTGLAVNGFLTALGGLVFLPEIFRNVSKLDRRRLKRLLLACVSVGVVAASFALAVTPASSQLGSWPFTAIVGSTTTKILTTTTTTTTLSFVSTISAATISSSTTSTLTFTTSSSTSSTVTSPTSITSLSIISTTTTSSVPGTLTSYVATKYTTLSTPGVTSISTTTTVTTSTGVSTQPTTLTQTSTSQLILPLGIPGFPWESILLGLGVGIFTLAVVRRRRRK